MTALLDASVQAPEQHREPRLGIIVRADEGGLGAQTWEYARHLQPHALLLLTVPPPRGEPHPSRFDGLSEVTRWSSFPPGDGELGQWAAFANECDVILTAETCYLADFPAMCERAGTKLVVHANPELWEWGSDPRFETWAPTKWWLERLPSSAEVVPVPVDRERCKRREVTEVKRLLHVSAPAMLDRCGTRLLADALPHCRTKFELLVSGPNAPPEAIGYPSGLIMRPVAAQRDYWRLYDEADALILPRRYGGLSLPMQEAASIGLPIVSLAVPPQIEWLHPALAVRAKQVEMARMKGGMVSVFGCDPVHLAQVIDGIVNADPEHVAMLTDASERFAASIGWQDWEPRYRERLFA